MESLGTYPLPAAQLDRFSICLSIGYPDEEAETELLHEQTHLAAAEPEPVTPVVSIQDIAASREEQRQVFVHPVLEKIIARIGKETRVHPAFRLGTSPRAGLHLLHLARTFALVNGRNWVEDGDIRRLAPLVLAHRCLIKTGDSSASELISSITEAVIRTADKQTDWTKPAEAQ